MRLEDLLRDLYPSRADLASLARRLQVRVPGWVDPGVSLLFNAVARGWEVRRLRPDAVSSLGAEARKVLVFIGDVGGVTGWDEVSERFDPTLVASLIEDVWLFSAENGRGHRAGRNGHTKDDRRIVALPDELSCTLGTRTDDELLTRRLFRLPPAQLKRLQASLRASGATRHAVVCEIRRLLLDPEHVHGALSALRPDERRLLDRLVLAGGWLSVEAACGAARRREGGLAAEEPLAGLAERGLAFLCENLHGEPGAVVLPTDLLRAVEIADPPRAAELRSALVGRLSGTLSGAEPVRRHGASVLEDLRVIVSALEGAPWRPTQGGGVRASDLKRLTAMLGSAASPRYVAFLWDLARSVEVVGNTGNRFTARGRGERLLRGTPAEALRALFDRFLADSRWLAASQDSPTWSDGIADPVRLKRSLFAALRSAGTEGWVAIHALVAQLYEWGLHPRFGADRGKAELSKEVSAIVSGPAAWLGVVDVAGDPASDGGTPRAVAARLTPVGAWLLGLAEAPPELLAGRADASAFFVQPNFEVLAPPGLDPELLRRLGRFSRPGRAGRFHLEPEALRAALDAGEAVDDVLSFLARHARAGVPENVASALRDWAGRHGEVVVSGASVLLSSADPGALARILAEPTVSSRATRLCEHAVVLQGEAREISRLVAWLRRKGYWAVAPASRADGRP